MHKHLSATATVLALLLTADSAMAAEPAAAAASEPAAEPAPDAGASAGAEVSLTGPKFEASASGKKADDGTANEPWIKRHRPVRNQMELGIYGGIMLPNTEHELYRPIDDGANWLSYKKLAPDIGLRFGYYPLSFLGLEVEGGVIPTKLRDGSDKALLGTFRGYGLLQLPYRIAPFALIGFGVMGTNGSKIGNDVDPALHFGGGVKFYINRLLALRIDARDNVTAQHNVDAGRTHHIEVLFGLSLLLNRKKPTPKNDPDTDGDGYKDSIDKCVNVPGVAPDGCPLAEEPDTDGDGFKDSVDACVDVPGTEPDGCPDTDGDGFKDNVDKCPQVAGIAPDGCPPPDTDGDGILDPNDKCVQEPESKNGYKDADGCPDEVPKSVARFSGVIKGIYFDVDKDSIKKTSKKTLDEAIKVLKENDDVRLEISGHTDSDGNRDHNIDLSARRAEAVKKYLVDAGIDAARLTSRGAGPDQPVADNKTKAGKALNRRIEFKLLSGK
jgi:outer membrane protein OmpA-like peptidoglycan-associated protein